MRILPLNEEYINSLNNVEKKKYFLKLGVVKYLYLKGQKTNNQICRRLSISSPTSIGLLNELLAEGLVEKKGRGESSGGRKPDLFSLKNNSFFVLAIHMGNFETEIALFDNNNVNISGSRILPLHLDNGIETIDALYNHAGELIGSSGIDPAKLLGIGVNLPGLVDAKSGLNYTYSFSEEASLKQALEEKFSRPVFVENDAKAQTMAEHRFGIARHKHNILAIFLEWGIGLGIIQEGKLYRGANGFAGEFGHIPIVENGELCSCGKQGCLETAASGMALVKMAEEGIRSGKSSILTDFPEKSDRRPDLSMIVDAAMRGDQYAINIIGKVGFNLGKGISILIQLFNPELIILSGKLSEAKQFLTLPVMQSLNEHCMPQLLERTSVQLSDLGRQAGILGSVAVVMENIFSKFS